MGVVRRTHGDQAALITTAPQDASDEYDKRRKKYAIMMATRALCVILAAVTYQVSFALAMVFVVAGVVLPWCAVLIANDRPPKRRVADLGYVSVPVERALPAGTDDRVVDG
jgi:Flp pilus assembly protein TadB